MYGTILMAVKREVIQGSGAWVERQEKEEPKARSPITGTRG